MSDDEQRTWLTYAEAGQVLGIKPSSVKRLSFRRHWPRRTGNDGHARVELPMAELRRVTGGATGDVPGGITGDTAMNALAVTGDSRRANGGASPPFPLRH